MAPHEHRSIDYLMPAKDIVTIRAEPYHDLLLPPMKKTVMKDIPESLKQPVIVAFGEKKL